MKNDKSYFSLKEYGGLIYPVVRRKKGKAKIDECPYCGEPHAHSLTTGHKESHCSDAHGYLKEIKIHNVIIPQMRGYFIEEY